MVSDETAANRWSDIDRHRNSVFRSSLPVAAICLTSLNAAAGCRAVLHRVYAAGFAGRVAVVSAVRRGARHARAGFRSAQGAAIQRSAQNCGLELSDSPDWLAARGCLAADRTWRELAPCPAPGSVD